MFLPREDLPSHSKICQYRRVKCPHQDGGGILCAERLQFGGMAEHFGQAHFIGGMYSDAKKFNTYRKVFIANFFQVLPRFIRFNDVFLFPNFEFSEATQIMYVFVYAGLAENDCNKFCCELKICKQDPTESVSSIGPVVSLDVPREQVQLSLTGAWVFLGYYPGRRP